MNLLPARTSVCLCAVALLNGTDFSKTENIQSTLAGSRNSRKVEFETQKSCSVAKVVL